MIKRTLLVILTLLPLLVSAETFVEGKDYVRLPQTSVEVSTKKSVIEFFSYGCPWCYKLEPTISAWRKTLPKSVEFTRVPVVFERGWDVYAKAYYTAKTLNLLDKMTPKLFDAIQEKNQRLNTNSQMTAFFIKEGVSKDIAENAFGDSPAIHAQVKKGMLLMHRFGITSVPTLVVNQTYRVDLQLAKGSDKRLMKIISYLLSKSS